MRARFVALRPSRSSRLALLLLLLSLTLRHQEYQLKAQSHQLERLSLRNPGFHSRIHTYQQALVSRTLSSYTLPSVPSHRSKSSRVSFLSPVLVSPRSDSESHVTPPHAPATHIRLNDTLSSIDVLCCVLWLAERPRRPGSQRSCTALHSLAASGQECMVRGSARAQIVLVANRNVVGSVYTMEEKQREGNNCSKSVCMGRPGHNF